MIKKSPNINDIEEYTFKLSIEIYGIGIVRAKYRQINELFTKKRVLNFSIIFRKFYSGNSKLFKFNFDPILCAQA